MTEKTAILTLSSLASGRLTRQDALTLYEAAGSASSVMEHRGNIRDIMPDATTTIVEYMKGDISAHVKRAEEEQQWCEANKVKVLTYADEAYPTRLKGCHDAPMTLFVRGDCNLNANHIINIVGTRKNTTYGSDVVENLVKDLCTLCPDIVIVSGLAYGIDIIAHRAALSNAVPTVGVVAHGQDRLYPQMHRTEANRMATGEGAVVTEYFRGTAPEARNFLQRNRIIAGMSDATIVAESATHGGALVTARLAQEYGREVFAIPGPVSAEYSKGCNNLIRDNKAALITSAEDLINAMMWQDAAQVVKARKQGIERTLFPTLTPEEQRIVEALENHGDSQSNALVAYTQLPISTVVAQLFSLEMKGLITSLPGNTYHLIR